MDAKVIKIEFVPAVGLYRRAVAMAKQAASRAAEHAATGKVERRMREIDAVMETIILSQAAAEGWIYTCYRQAQVTPPNAGWRRCWTAAPAEIAEPSVRSLEAATVETLEWLSAWRNWLAHDDDRARERLSHYVEVGTERDHLTAAMAAEVITRMDAAFTDLGAIIGYRTSSAPHSDYLWVAADEA
jgi:hypothetical protein